MFGKGWTAVGEETDNRFLLLDFCRANDLIVANTWFQQPAAKQVTFKEPSTHFLPPDNTDWDPANFAQLDFCLLPQRWRNSRKNKSKFGLRPFSRCFVLASLTPS